MSTTWPVAFDSLLERLTQLRHHALVLRPLPALPVSSRPPVLLRLVPTVAIVGARALLAPHPWSTATK